MTRQRKRTPAEKKVARWAQSTERLGRALLKIHPSGAARERAAWFVELLGCVLLLVENGTDVLAGAVGAAESASSRAGESPGARRR